MSLGHSREGGSTSGTTVTTNRPVAVSPQSVTTVQVTTVGPGGKTDPDAGSQVRRVPEAQRDRTTGSG